MQLSKQYSEWLQRIFASADAEVKEIWNLHEHGGILERRLLGGAMTRAQSLQHAFLRSFNQVGADLEKATAELQELTGLYQDSARNTNAMRASLTDAERALNQSQNHLPRAREELRNLSTQQEGEKRELNLDDIKLSDGDSSDNEEETAEARAQRLQAEVTTLTEQIPQQRETIAEYRQQLQQLEREEQTLATQVEQTKAEVERLKAIHDNMPQAFHIFEPWNLPRELAQALYEEFRQPLYTRLLAKSEVTRLAHPTMQEYRQAQMPAQPTPQDVSPRRLFNAAQARMEFYRDISIEINGVQQDINSLFILFFTDARTVMSGFQLRQYRGMLRDVIQKVINLSPTVICDNWRVDLLERLRDVDDLLYLKALETAAAEPAQKPGKFAHFTKILQTRDEQNSLLVPESEYQHNIPELEDVIQTLDMDYKKQDKKDGINDPLIVKSRIYTILYLDKLLQEGIDYHEGDPKAKLRGMQITAEKVLFSQHHAQKVGRPYDQLDQAKYELMTAWFYYAQDLLSSRGLAAHKGMWRHSAATHENQDQLARFPEFKRLISGYATNSVGKYEQKLLLDRTVASVLLWLADGAVLGTAYVGGMSLATGCSMGYIMTKARTTQIFDIMASLDESQQCLVLLFLSLGIMAIIGIEYLHAQAEPIVKEGELANQHNREFTRRLEAELQPVLFPTPVER